MLDSCESDTTKSNNAVTVRLVLVRHGESEANQRGLIAGQEDFVSINYVCLSGCGDGDELTT